MRSRWQKLLIVVIAGLAAGAFAASSEREAAPRFRARTLSGEVFTNESVKGKVVLLQFWTAGGSNRWWTTYR